MPADEYEYWDVGVKEPIRLTDKPLAGVLRAAVLCDAKITCVHSMEKVYGKPELKYPNRYCCAVFRVALPKGMKDAFEAASGMTLTAPPKVHLN